MVKNRRTPIPAKRNGHIERCRCEGLWPGAPLEPNRGSPARGGSARAVARRGWRNAARITATAIEIRPATAACATWPPHACGCIFCKHTAKGQFRAAPNRQEVRSKLVQDRPTDLCSRTSTSQPSVSGFASKYVRPVFCLHGPFLGQVDSRCCWAAAEDPIVGDGHHLPNDLRGRVRQHHHGVHHLLRGPHEGHEPLLVAPGRSETPNSWRAGGHGCCTQATRERRPSCARALLERRSCAAGTACERREILECGGNALSAYAAQRLMAEASAAGRHTRMGLGESRLDRRHRACSGPRAIRALSPFPKCGVYMTALGREAAEANPGDRTLCDEPFPDRGQHTVEKAGST